MSLKRYEHIRRYLHVNDNTETKDDSSRLFQSRTRDPRFAHKSPQRRARVVPANRRKILTKEDSQEGIQKLCLGRFLWDHLQSLFLRRIKSARWEKCGASEVVLRLVKELPKNENFQLFMDNCFSKFTFLSELKIIGILSVVTFCPNCLGECTLMSEKNLKKRGCGSFDYWTDYNTRTHVLKWFEDKCAVVGSNFAGVECINSVERYDLAQKKKVKINCPDIVSQYSRSMGYGGDQWWELVWLILWQKKVATSNLSSTVGIVKVNAWILYQRH